MDDSALLRARFRSITAGPETTPPKGPEPFVGIVFAQTMLPTAAGLYFATHPLDITGNEIEGGSATLTTNSDITIFVDIIGRPAAVGDLVLARWVGYRWVAVRLGSAGGGGGGGTVSTPGCACASSPVTITQTSSEPASNNRMFQDASIVYGPTPPALLPVVLQPSSYISTASFPDPIVGSSFYYYFTCYFGGYALSRVYPTSVLGNPYRDAIRYSWIPGFPGNTCTPFLLASGEIYSGGDRTCNVVESA
jgi:hypothetical protein